MADETPTPPPEAAAGPSSTKVVAFGISVIERSTEPQRQFVLVHEKEERGWWLPGGAVDAGQTLPEAAIRESVEEAGCSSETTGVLRVEYSRRDGRLRLVWLARPLDEAPLKTVADKESRGARWMSYDECVQLDAGSFKDKGSGTPVEHCWMRGGEPLAWFGFMSRAERHVAPCDFVRCSRALPSAEVQAEIDAGLAKETPAQTKRRLRMKPKRDVYKTRTLVQVMVLHLETGRCLTSIDPHTGARCLPMREPPRSSSESLHSAAREAASSVAAGLQDELAGVLRFEHRLWIADINPKKHHAYVVCHECINPQRTQTDLLRACQHGC